MNRLVGYLMKGTNGTQRINRWAATALIAGSAVLANTSAFAASNGYSDSRGEPRWEDQVVDAVIARPVGVLLTGAGAVVWGVSLPFSLLGGNAGEAGDKLVGGPGRETFARCLGCKSAGRSQAVVNSENE